MLCAAPHARTPPRNTASAISAALAAVAVAELAPQRRGRGRGDDVRADHPRDVREPAEVGRRWSAARSPGSSGPAPPAAWRGRSRRTGCDRPRRDGRGGVGASGARRLAVRNGSRLRSEAPQQAGGVQRRARVADEHGQRARRRSGRARASASAGTTVPAAPAAGAGDGRSPDRAQLVEDGGVGALEARVELLEAQRPGRSAPRGGRRPPGARGRRAVRTISSGFSWLRTPYD